MKRTILCTVSVYLLIVFIVVGCSPIENETYGINAATGRLIVWKRADAGYGDVALSLDKGGTIDHYTITYEYGVVPDCKTDAGYEADIKQASADNKKYILTATAQNGLKWRKEITFTDGYCDHLELYTDNAEIASLTCAYSLYGKWKRLNNAGTFGTLDMELNFINDTGYVTYSNPLSGYPAGTKKMYGFKNTDCTIQDYITGYGYTTRTIKFINADNIMINNQILYKRIP